MVVRSTAFTKVPLAVRHELEQRLVEKGFSGYDELSSWLKGLGFDISMSSVGRFARQFERRVSAI